MSALLLFGVATSGDDSDEIKQHYLDTADPVEVTEMGHIVASGKSYGDAIDEMVENLMKSP